MGRYRKKRNIMSLDLTPLIDVVEETEANIDKITTNIINIIRKN